MVTYEQRLQIIGAMAAYLYTYNQLLLPMESISMARNELVNVSHMIHAWDDYYEWVRKHKEEL